MNKRFLTATFLLAFSAGAALADEQRVRPSYPCSRAAYADGLTRMICESPDLSRVELSFAQVYFARRFAADGDGQKLLKAESHSVNSIIRSTCGIPKEGAADQKMPPNSAACYAAETEKYRRRWLLLLHGTALEEASRPVEQNIALQQRLVDRGYLPPDSVVDGVFGEGTRAAITTWQRVAGRPTIDGFLSNEDASALLTPTSSDATPTQALVDSAVKADRRQEASVETPSPLRQPITLPTKPSSGDQERMVPEVINDVASPAIGASLQEFKLNYAGSSCSADGCDFDKDSPSSVCPSILAECQKAEFFVTDDRISGYKAELTERDWATSLSSMEKRLGNPKEDHRHVLTLMSNSYSWSFRNGYELLYMFVNGTNYYGVPLDSHIIMVHLVDPAGK